MKLRMVGLIFCVCTLVALDMPAHSAAHETASPAVEHQRYRVVILGTDGGADSFLAGYLFYAPLNDRGTIGVAADTSVAGAYNSYTSTGGKQTDFQALPGPAGSPANGTYINWMNQLGFAVGYSANGVQDPIVGGTESEAVLWAPNGQIFNLGTLGGYQSHAIWVNDFGQVSGWVENTTADPFSEGAGAETRGFIWQLGVMRTFGTLGGPDSYGEFINNLGQVSGHSYTSDTANGVTGVPPFDPFIWQDGKMTDINPGNFGGAEGGTNFLSNHGHAVGFGTLAGEAVAHPFLWQNGKLTDLFTVGNLGGSLNSAYNVNELGHVVGVSSVSDNSAFHAVLWRDGTFTDLLTVDGDGCSEPYRINSHEQIVGISAPCDFSAEHAFLWENGGMVDLNTLIPSNSGIQLLFAAWINDDGEIAAQAILTSTGAYRAVLLIPDGACDGDCAATAEASQKKSSNTPQAAEATQTMLNKGAFLGVPANPARPSLLRPFPPARPPAQKQD
jgi:probable HAF family extracellular repeat protein